MENVAFEDIQVTNASLAEGHGSHPAKRDKEEELEEELENEDKADLDKDGKLSSYEKKRGAAIEKAMKDKKEKMDEAQIRQIIRKLVKEAMAKKEG